MAQQVFPQWSPVVKAHNEDQQEVYIPAAIIHAQTRDGKDELIVGAANMQFDPETGDYLPTHAGNPVEVRARALETLLQTLGKEETLDGVKSAVDALAGTVDAGAQKVTLTGHTVDMATETTLAQSVDKLNSILSRLESKLDTAIFDSQGNPISAANRLPVDAAVSGTVDVSDRADRQLGKVALTGHVPQPSSTIPVDVKGGGPATYKLVEQRTEADAVGDTLSFSGPIIIVEIWNLDPYNVGVFVVNGVSITMPPQAHFFAQVGTFLGTEVTVSGSDQYIVGRYE